MANKGQRLLIRAIKQKKIPLIKTILESGCHPNFLDAAGVSPLCEAIRQRSLPAVMMLVEAKADVNIMDKGGTMPLRLASDCGMAAIVHYLRDVGARLEPKKDQDIGYADAPLPSQHQGRIFKLDDLPRIFAADKWIGRIQEMKELWEEVPSHLRARFNFEAALIDTKQATLRQRPRRKSEKFKL